MSLVTKDQIAALYIAVYGRAPEAEGFKFWTEEFEGTFAEAAEGFVAHPLFAAEYGDLSNQEKVEKFYTNILGSEGDIEGIDYWVARLENGEDINVVLTEFLTASLTGDFSEDPAAQLRQNTLKNKVEVGIYYAEKMGDASNFPEGTDLGSVDVANSPAFIAAAAAIAGVTNDKTTVDAAKVAIDDKAPGVPGDTFTLTELPTQTTTVLEWNGVDAEVALSFLQSISDLSLEDLGVEVSGDKIVNVGSITITDNPGGSGGSTIVVVLDDGSSFEATIDTPAALYAEIMDGLIQREEITQSGIVLTPTQNNGGTFEAGNTTGGDDLIIAGRPELLHGAYIDGGKGYNTLEVDMKGFFAQPFQLLNIQEVHVQNLPSVYDVDQTILDFMDGYGFPVSNEDGGPNSILDLSRASSLERLVINEGGMFNVDGALAILGIKGNAVARLEGNFTQDVNLFYGRGLGNAVELEFANVTMSEGEVKLGHNAGTVNLLSEGRLNVIQQADFGSHLRELNVTGTGELSIEDNLNFAFNEATIDASENTGGLRISLSHQTNGLAEVNIQGSQARDVIEISGTATGVVLDINTNSGRDTLIFNNVDAGAGSVIVGAELTIRIEGGETRLDLVQLPDDASFQIADGATLVVTQAQVDQLGVDAFGSLHRDGGTLKVLVQEDSDFAALGLDALSRELELGLELDDDVTLEITREQLDRPGGIEIDARAANNDSTVVVTDLPADSQTTLSNFFGGGTPVENIVISIDGLVAEDGFAILGGGLGATLSVAGENDLTAGALWGIDEVEYAESGASLTLTEWQVRVIDEDEFGVADGVTGVTLNVTELDNSEIDLEEIADAGINIGTLTVEDAGGVVILHADTTLGGADEVIVPKGTTLELTAAQFLQLNGGVISGEGTVNITGLTQDDIDAGLDLSTITAVHGQITLADNDVTLDVATDLGEFGVHLTGVDIVPGNPMEGQTIRFATAEQASRDITVDGAPNETNVVWLEDGDFAGNVVDTSGYSGGIGRLWISEALVESTPGNNVEALYTQLSGNIIVRIYTDDLLAVSNPINRVVEVEAFAQIDDLSFVDADADAPFQHVQSLTITMGGASDIGDLMIDNIVAPDVVNDTPFQTLTINSFLANSNDHYLLPEDFDPDFNALPSQIADPLAQRNVIGDIGSGPGREELANVVINTSSLTEVGVALDIQTITFSETEATVANLTLNGAKGVTIKSLDTSDVDITGLTVTNTGAGTVTVTGGSPAAAVSNTEELNIVNNGGDVAFGTATDGNGDPYAGVAGLELSLIAVSGGGNVNLGVIAQVDSEDFVLNGGNANNTTAVLGEANVDGALVAPELAATGEWAISNTTLTITEDVTLNAGGTLTLNGVALTIEGDVDFTDLDLTITGGSIEVPAGATLSLTAEQADGVNVTGDGEVIITELEADTGADLSDITAATTLVLTEDVASTGSMPNADVTIEGAFELDVTGAWLSVDTTFEVPAGANLVLTDGQADELAVTGAGAANVVMGSASDDDLSNIAVATTITISGPTVFEGTFNATLPVTVAGAGDFDITVGSDGAQNLPASVVLDKVSLTATAEQLDGLSVTDSGSATSSVTAVEFNSPDASDLSGVEVPLTVDTTGGNVEFVGQIGAVELTVDGGSQFDITGATVAATSIVVTAGTLVLTGAQADGLTITGGGDVTLTDVASGQDFSGITTTGALKIQAADAVTDLSLTAAQLDGLTVSVEGIDLTKLIVTEFEAAPDADLSGVTVVPAADVEVQLNSSGDVEIGADANLGVTTTGDVNVVISGNGEVTVADGADLSAVDAFVVNAGARLVVDQNLADLLSQIDPGIVEGAGALEVVMATGGAIVTATEEIRQTIFTFEEGVGGVQIDDFTAGTFSFGGGALEVGVHRLDFTDLFSTDPEDFTDVTVAFAAADQSATADILSFSVADLTNLNAGTVETALKNGGDFTNAGADTSFGANAEKIFLVSDGTDAMAFFWQDGHNNINDGVVQANELTAIVQLTGMVSGDLGDLVNANFMFA